MADISWARVNKPADVLTVGQRIEVKVLKADPGKRRISLGMKQLQPHPWDQVSERFKVGDRVHGAVTRVPFPGHHSFVFGLRSDTASELAMW